MQLYSTRNRQTRVSLKDAIFKGLPSDNGLYLPVIIPLLEDKFFKEIHNFSLTEIAIKVSQALIGNEINQTDLRKIVEHAINFEAPVVQVHDNIYSLELFHGPSLAFKDFGARFMASLMSYYLSHEEAKDINILVATSGDTGSAVAQGFLNMDNIKVTILYPSKKVSDIQEKQLTTLGHNVTALEVDGTFDDCQKMVKMAFLDHDLCQKITLTSANSINISRLIPQSFYYFYAYAQLPNRPIVFSVPCGNLGNLCGGLIAKQMGLPVAKFIASTNINNVFPEYLDKGIFTSRPSVQTIANAMDVGNPSNFARLNEFYQGDVNKMHQDIHGCYYTDKHIKATLKSVYDEFAYILDPHGAIAYQGLVDYLQTLEEPNSNTKFKQNEINGIFLETAHPAKFKEDVESAIGIQVSLPESLSNIIKQNKQSLKIKAEFNDLKDFLLKSE